MNKNQVAAKNRNRKGQTLAEYGLIMAFVSVVAIGALSAMGTNVKGVFTTISSQLSAAGNGGASAPAAPVPPPRGG